MPKARKWWKKILILVATLLVLAEIVLYIGISVNASRLDTPRPADVLIVLGAGIRSDGTPSPMLQRRLDRAAGLYREGYASYIITTGGQGANEPMPEGVAMKAYLEGAGIAAEAIIAEDASFNTRQNLQNAKAIMDEMGLKDAVVVSSDYHLWRALSLCEDLGINATGAGAQNALTRRQAVVNCLRETLSWWKYLLIG